MKVFIGASLILTSIYLNTFSQTDRPILFQEGIINTGEYETHPAFSPSGETLYFLKCTPDINNSCTICISFLKAGQWTKPIIAPFSGQYMDIDPFVTADGKTLYFGSNRPITKGGTLKRDIDIWRVAIHSTGWGEPEHLNEVINSDQDEYYPTLSDNGNLYFGSTRGTNGSDIYFSKLIDGKFGEPETLGSVINTSDHEYEPFIAPDESFIIFMATIPKGLPNADLFISFRTEDHWGKVQKLPEPINSPFTEWSPKITRDNRFFFSSTRSIPVSPQQLNSYDQLQKRLNSVGNGLGDIYFMDAKFLKTLKHSN